MFQFANHCNKCNIKHWNKLVGEKLFVLPLHKIEQKHQSVLADYTAPNIGQSVISIPSVMSTAPHLPNFVKYPPQL